MPKNTLSREDAEFICRYHLRNTNTISPSQAQTIINDPQTLHLFATKEPKHAFNKACLGNICNKDNPVAVIRPIYKSTGNKGGKAKATHFKKDNQVPSTNYICRGAKVEITGRNILPELGLYNSSMGEVVDIVYQKHESPNTGFLPRYVLVRMPAYKGPPFIQQDPKIIPVVPISRLCPNRCCEQTFIPLKVCFAKTIHTFQGSSAGPVAPGQQQNSIQKLVIDLGDRKFEGNNPGLSYTAFGRATQLGTPDDIMSSALFFDGPHVNPGRLMNITTRADNKGYYKKVMLRQKWVNHLKSNTIQLSYHQQQSTSLFEWSESWKPTNDQIRQFHKIFTEP